MKKQRRKLSIITQDLRIALKRETTDIIGIGDLLIEAKEHLKHGKWLPWLKQEFSLSDRSARNYMQAAKFAAKSETVSDLGNLSPSALYAISSDSGFYTPEIIKVILQEAKKNRVGKDRAWDIALSLMPEEDEKKPPISKELQQQFEQEAEAAAKDKEEAEAILDGPPPLPSPPTDKSSAPLPRDQALLASFSQAVRMLADLATKPCKKFAGADSTVPELENVVAFLGQVVAIKLDVRESHADPPLTPLNRPAAIQE